MRSKLTGCAFPQKSAQQVHVTFDDVIDGEAVRQQLQPIIDYIAGYDGRSDQTSPSFCVQGYSGTGKSLMRDCLIAETGANSANIEPHDWMLSSKGEYLEADKATIDIEIEKLEQNTPCIVSLPDLGKLEPERENYLIDKIQDTPGLVLYAMENPWEAHEPDFYTRFGHNVTLSLPDEARRQYFLNKVEAAFDNGEQPRPYNFNVPMGVTMDIDTGAVAQASEGLSYRDLKRFVRQAAKDARFQHEKPFSNDIYRDKPISVPTQDVINKIQEQRSSAAPQPQQPFWKRWLPGLTA